MRVAIITSSDSGYAGEREDKSGPVIAEMVTAAGYTVVSQEILPDDYEMLTKRMAEICDSHGAELILTTGGTGFSVRDIMGNSRGHAGLQHAVYAESHALKSSQRHPEAHPYREYAGKSQGRAGEPGIHPSLSGTRSGDSDRGGDKLRENLIGNRICRYRQSAFTKRPGNVILIQYAALPEGMPA